MCAPPRCPDPYLQSRAEPCTRVHRGRLPPAASWIDLAHRMPPFRLSAGRECVQSAAQLRYLQRHRLWQHVLGALLPVALTQSAVSGTLHAPRSLAACRLPPRTSHRTVCSPSDSPSGSAHAPCPPTTSCRSVAHGRASRPSPPLNTMTRTGLQEAARVAEIA